MFYGIFSTIVFIIILPFWLILGLFKPKLIYGFCKKCGVYKELNRKHETEKNNFSNLCHCEEGQSPDAATQRKKTSTILFYAISVGEVIAIENLVKKTRESFPDINIVLMTGTKTGQDIAHKKMSETANLITYFPFDFPFSINNMLNKIKPDAIFVMETELWPNFANITNKKNIPTFIINARISDRTYKSYKKLSFFFGPILKKYTAIFPQSRQDSEKLISIGANPETTKIMGNLKFDIKTPEISTLNFEKNAQEKILIAGSTHSGEDEIVLEIFADIIKEIPNLKLIIAPRHPERNERVFDLIKGRGFDCVKRSEQKVISSNSPTLKPSVLLLDTMGELGKFYSVCDVAFLGGSFNKTGGHNPLEATIFKKPVVSGPSINNFKDIYAILTNTDAGFVGDSNGVKERIKALLMNEDFYKQASLDCEKVFEENKGALQFVIEVLQKIV